MLKREFHIEVLITASNQKAKVSKSFRCERSPENFDSAHQHQIHRYEIHIDFFSAISLKTNLNRGEEILQLNCYSTKVDFETICYRNQFTS